MLTGNNKIGAYGLAAARHLINHGCHVVVCASEKRQGLGDAIAQQEAMFEHVGGKIVYDIQGILGDDDDKNDLLISTWHTIRIEPMVSRLDRGCHGGITT